MLLLLVLIEMVGAPLVPTLMVILFDTAESGTAHEEFEVTTQLTTSAFDKADEE